MHFSNEIDGTKRGGTLAAVMLATALGSNAAAAAAPEPCDMRLTVDLTPDIPDSRDPGFLSSLLSGYSGYRLMLRKQLDSSAIVVELTGPGPDSDCRNAIEAIRKDGRVLFVHEEVS
jgi:hypothetical protein